MKKKIFWIYIASVFVLFLAVGFIARQWFVGADPLTYDGSWPTGCWLNSRIINIHCSEEEVKGHCGEGAMACAGHSYIEGISHMYLSPEMCYVMMLPSGPTVNSEALRAQINCNMHTLHMLDEPYWADVCCMVEHEFAHLCNLHADGSGEDVNRACSEVFAESREDQCRRNLREVFCEDINDKNREWCMENCNIDAARAAYSAWDTCMCNTSAESGSVDTATCCACTEECEKKVPSMIPEYCHQFGIDYAKKAIDDCKWMGLSSSAHSCDYYNNGLVNGNKCEGGTGYSPEMCKNDFSECAVPNDKVSHKGINDQSCAMNNSGTISKYISFFFKRLPNAPAEWPSDYGCMYSKYSCVKGSCDLKTTTEGTATAISSSSTTSRALTETANAATPLSGVTIKAQKDRGPYSITDNAIHTIGTTGTDGKVAMSLLLGSWKIIAEKQGFKTSTQYLKVEKDTPFNLNFNMTPDGTTPVDPTPETPTPETPPVVAQNSMSVGVFGRTSSAPISDATVKISKDDKNFTQTTDASGSASFPNLEPGTWNIEVSKSGYIVDPNSPTTKEITASNSGGSAYNININMLEASGSLTVRTYEYPSPTNRVAAPGVTVAIKLGSETKTQTTDSNGSTTFTGLLTGAWTVTGEKTNYVKTDPQGYGVSASSPGTVDLVMHSDLRNITVSLKTNNGSNMANVQVSVAHPDGITSKTTDSNGKVVFSGIRRGMQRVIVNRQGWALTPNQNLSFLLQEDTTKDFVMERAGNHRFYISGRFLGLSIPLPGAKVKLCNLPLSNSHKVCTEQVTNLAGFAVFSGINPVRHYYEVTAANYSTSTSDVAVESGRTGISNIQLERPTWYQRDYKDLAIQVKTTSGTNFPNTNVIMSGPGGTINKTTDAAGRVEFGGLNVGTWNISIKRSGWTLAPDQEVSFDLNDNITKELKVQRAGSVRFSIKRLVLGIRVPLPGATITFCDKPSNDPARKCTTQKANLLGNSTFTDFLPKKYYYEVSSNNFQIRVGNFTIEEHKTGERLVTLSPR